MSIRRLIIFGAASVGLLGSAAACSGTSPTAPVTNVTPPARDTAGFIPPVPPMTGP
jgi:hypothetical protein